jgi:threonine/homoserine/homoserine lactone efflux protein
MDLHNVILFMAAGLTLNITPGPDMLYVITRSVSEGRLSGIVSAFGIMAGCIVHTLAIAFGLTAFLLAVPTAYDIIKYLGAAYLVYLGIKKLFAKNNINIEENSGRIGLKRVFLQGMLTNVLNPKVALFFLAFLPQFITPGENTRMQLIILGMMFNISGTTVNVLVASFASRIGVTLKNKLLNSSIFKWITASVFIGLGVRLAFLNKE